MTRPPSEVEKYVVQKIANRLPRKAREQLLDDLRIAMVTEVAADGSRIVFSIMNYDRPESGRMKSFGIEGELLDKDGTKVSLDLFADENGRLFELELIRWGHGDLIEPNWATLEVR
jgi:hypothetical protein